MNKIIFAYLIIVSLILVSNLVKSDASDASVFGHIDDINFVAELQKYKVLVALVYQQKDCTTCVEMEGQLKEAIEILKVTHNTKFKFVKIDRFESTGLASRLSPDFVPALQLIKLKTEVDIYEEEKLKKEYQDELNYTYIRYRGPVTANLIVNWILKIAKNPITDIKTQDEFNKFVTQNEIAVIHFGQNYKYIDKESDQRTGLERTVVRLNAYNFYQLNFARITDPDLTDLVTNFKQTQLGIYIRGMKNPILYDEQQFLYDDVKFFIEKNAKQLLIQFGEEHIQQVFRQTEIPTIFMFFNNETQASEKSVFSKVASQYYKQIMFAISSEDDGQGQYGGLTHFLEIDVSKIPQVIIVKPVPGYIVDKEKFTQEFNYENLVTFIDEYLSKSNSTSSAKSSKVGSASSAKLTESEKIDL